MGEFTEAVLDAAGATIAVICTCIGHRPFTVRRYGDGPWSTIGHYSSLDAALARARAEAEGSTV